jgi:copper resistance protein D
MSFAVINNFLHLLATVSWIGGIVFMNVILFPSQTVIDPGQRGKFLGTVVKKFLILVWVSVVVLLLTGLYKTPSSMLFNPESRYGFWLTIKHATILLMIFFGLMVTFVIFPKLRKLTPKPGEQPSSEFIRAQKNMSLIARTNMILGIIVLFCVSMMQYY